MQFDYLARQVEQERVLVPKDFSSVFYSIFLCALNPFAELRFKLTTVISVRKSVYTFATVRLRYFFLEYK